jgi:hypothetical protein
MSTQFTKEQIERAIIFLENKAIKNRDYYWANRDKALCATKKWKKENPERQKVYRKRYKNKRIIKQRGIEELRKQEFLSRKHTANNPQ